jgi:multidrug transporter EmrE-like cation transporter
MTTIYRPLFFIFYETLFTSVVLAVAVMARRNDRIRLKELSGNGALKHAIAAGLLCTVAYTLILVAMGHVSNVSYVSAFRQLSIPLGTAAGIVIFKEDSYPAKIVSVCLIVTGLAMVKFL